MKVSAPVPLHKYLAGLFLRRFAPKVTLASTLIDEYLTRDPEMLALRKADPLHHSRIGAELFFGMVEGGRKLLAEAEKITIPTLLILGGADPVVEPAVTRGFFDRMGSTDKTLRLYPDMVHEPLNDLGREAVVEEITAWLAHHLDPATERVTNLS